MYRRLFALFLLLLLLSGCSSQKLQMYEITWVDVFDTVTTLRGYETDQKTFHQKAAQVHELLQYYHRAFDIYNPSPDGNSLYTINENAGIAPVTMDDEIIWFLLDCRDDFVRTDGRVNVAMGSVLQLWHDAREAEVPYLPSREALEDAAQHCSFDTVQIDTEKRTVYLSDAQQRLDVGALAKGWAGQRAMEILPDGYLLNLGGNTCAAGSKPDGSPWRIGVQSPTQLEEYLCLVEVQDMCAVTSGDYQRFFILDGVRYHHIIDPDTLMPSTYWRSVTVLCPDSGLADCLSTALFLMPLEDGQRLAADCGAEALWVALDGTISHTDGFHTVG